MNSEKQTQINKIMKIDNSYTNNCYGDSHDDNYGDGVYSDSN